MVTPANVAKSTLRVPVQGNEALDAWKARALAMNNLSLERYVVKIKTTKDGLAARDKFAKDLLTERIEKDGYVPQLLNYATGHTTRVDVTNPKTRAAVIDWIKEVLADPTNESIDMLVQLVASVDVVKRATGIMNVETLKKNGYVTVREEQAKFTIKKVKD